MINYILLISQKLDCSLVSLVMVKYISLLVVKVYLFGKTIMIHFTIFHLNSEKILISI